MSSAAISDTLRIAPYPKEHTGEPYKIGGSDATHEPMTKTEQMEIAITAMAQALTAQANGKTKLNGYATPLFTFAAIVVALFGLRFVPAGSADLKEEVHLQGQSIITLQAELAKTADKEQSLEYIFANARQQLAALGIQIDPKTGNIEIKRGNK